jgi:hypothetical protein
VTPWAEVRVDGVLIGTTPLDKIEFDAGTHRVRIRHPNYEPIEREVIVYPEKVEKLVVNLRLEGIRKQQ